MIEKSKQKPDRKKHKFISHGTKHDLAEQKFNYLREKIFFWNKKNKYFLIRE
jgi:hypothetical protein